MSARWICDNQSLINSKNLKYEIRAKKARKSERNRKILDEDAMLCNTLWSDRRRLITKKHFLAFRLLLNVGIDPNFPQKSFFFFLAFFREKFLA